MNTKRTAEEIVIKCRRSDEGLGKNKIYKNYKKYQRLLVVIYQYYFHEQLVKTSRFFYI